MSVFIKSLAQPGRRWRLLDAQRRLEKWVRSNRLDRLEVTLAQRDQAKVGADQLDVWNAVALDDRASGFDQRRVPVQTMAYQGQSAMGCIDFGSGLLESESTHEPNALTG